MKTCMLKESLLVTSQQNDYPHLQFLLNCSASVAFSIEVYFQLKNKRAVNCTGKLGTSWTNNSHLAAWEAHISFRCWWRVNIGLASMLLPETWLQMKANKALYLQRKWKCCGAFWSCNYYYLQIQWTSGTMFLHPPVVSCAYSGRSCSLSQINRRFWTTALIKDTKKKYTHTLTLLCQFLWEFINSLKTSRPRCFSFMLCTLTWRFWFPWLWFSV